jgi:trehalose 6-phosphate phosphatase
LGLSQMSAQELQGLVNRAGRALADLVPRLDGAIPYLVGNHGIESPIATPDSLRMAEEVCLKWKQTIDTDFSHTLKTFGAEVEDKRYTITLHYRGTAEPARLRELTSRL